MGGFRATEDVFVRGGIKELEDMNMSSAGKMGRDMWQLAIAYWGVYCSDEEFNKRKVACRVWW